MKTAWLLHGTGGNNQDYFWFSDTKKFLEEKGYQVWWPQLPHTEKPELVETRNFIEETMPGFDGETIIIGHSSACPLILHLMESFEVEIKQAVLVAGFYEPLDDNGYSNLMLPKNFDWNRIISHAGQIVLINSDNDPWGCDDKQAKPIADKLGAKFVLAKKQGHMGSVSFDQSYREFPILKELLLV